jgi:hypothetical protein
MSKHGRYNFGAAYAVNTGPDGVEGELDRLRRELAELKATLADREIALANAALDAQQSRERWQQETQRALSEAEQVWKAEQAARLAAAEAQCRRHAHAVPEGGARYEAAEVKVEPLGREVARERNDFIAGALSARPSLETKFEHHLSDTQTERGYGPKESRIVLRPDRIWINEAVEQRRRTARKSAGFGVLGAALLGLFAIAVYSGIGAIQQNRSNTAVAGAPGRIPGGSDIPKANGSKAVAVVVRDVNVRANPSASASVVSKLPRGLKVAIIEQRGSWTMVQLEKSRGNTGPRRGWVYRSFLKDE